MTDFVHDILETPDLHIYSSKMNPSYINAAMSIEGSSDAPTSPDHSSRPYFNPSSYSYAILDDTILDISTIRHQIQDGNFKFLYMTKPVYEAIIQYGPIINGHEKMILICDTDDDIYQHYCESQLLI